MRFSIELDRNTNQIVRFILIGHKIKLHLCLLYGVRFTELFVSSLDHPPAVWP